MKEKLIGRAFCQDEEYLWCYDEVICALSRIDMKTMEVECMVSPMQILLDKEYHVGRLMAWKDRIIIIPAEIGEGWIIYEKKTGKVNSYKFSSENYELGEVFLKKDQLIILPALIKDPIVIIDLLKRRVIKKIFFPDRGILLEENMAICDARIDHEDICFFVRNSYFYGRFNNDGIQLIRILVEEPLACAEFYEGTGWAVNGVGDQMYQFDKDGNLLKSVTIDAKAQIGMMILERRRIFLLPIKEAEIKVFDIDREQIMRLDMQYEKEGVVLPEVFSFPDYWCYLRKDGFVWVLPLKHSLQIIDTASLECKQEELEYSTDFSEHMYGEYYKYARKKRTFIFYENSLVPDMRRYLELVKQSKALEHNGDEIIYGREIWKLFG